MELPGLAAAALAVACLLLLLLLALALGRRARGRGRLPPGPRPLPLLGNLLQLDLANMGKSLWKLGAEYGPIYTVHLGPRRVVVLCDYGAIREALVEQAESFADRGEEAIYDRLFQGYGCAFCPWERAKPLRRFAISTLRDFGVGKRGIEERILEEARFLVEVLADTRGRAVDPAPYLNRAVSNVISSVVFGSRFDYGDAEFLSLLHMMTEVFRFTSTSWGQLYEMFSGIMNLLPGPHQAAFKHLQGLEAFMERKVREKEKTLVPGAPRDLIDSFLLKREQEKGDPGSEFTRRNAVLSALNVFFAGTETVSTTLRYGLLLLLAHPQVEARLHAEIDREIGRQRGPRLDDRRRMPYTDAVVHEIQRFADVIPMGLTRRATRDTRLRGYAVPKGTEVIAVLSSALKDPQHFARPDVFDPGHFLDESGSFRKNEAFLPFSAGKRNCFGEMLARTELFLFLTCILQRFSCHSPVAREHLSVAPALVGFSSLPPAYRICFVPR
ncbi:cytochrome P450 2A11-like [Struthio camelus]|uniref:cytochrome P450 2A11-like n=1 Tax=Struthio camelus TaxID=8801 RepID=UPI003603EFF5